MMTAQAPELLEVERRGRSGLRPEPVAIDSVVYPKTTDEVRAAVIDARRRGVPVYPVSAGRNWGYGASAPPRSGCILLDLSGMNRIIGIDEDLCLVHIQPGVTQGQLFERLAGSGLMMDVTGAGPATSIVGNVLERGFGHTPLGYRSQHFVISECVLADGTILRPNEGLSEPGIGRVGLSAGLHELLQQNNLAVVTGMYVPIMRRPEAILRCVFELPSTSGIPGYIDAMRQLKAEGVFQGAPHIGNRLRVNGMLAHPRSGRGKAPDQDSWTLVSALYGSRGVVRAKAKRAREMLGHLGTLRFLSQTKVDLVRRASEVTAAVGPRFGKTMVALSERYAAYANILSLVEGNPSGIALRACYDRNRSVRFQPGSDPVQDGCGFRWLAPALPMKGAEVMEFLAVAQRLYDEYHFKLAVTLTALTPTLCQAIMSVFYDTQVAAEWERANNLAARLRQEFRGRGWICYRLAIDEMEDELAHTDPSLTRLRAGIKSAFDEHGTISPGRYSA